MGKAEQREMDKTMDMSAFGPLNCSRNSMLHFTFSLDEIVTADLVHAARPN